MAHLSVTTRNCTRERLAMMSTTITVGTYLDPTEAKQRGDTQSTHGDSPRFPDRLRATASLTANRPLENVARWEK
jgi:hypothetical protein